MTLGQIAYGGRMIDKENLVKNYSGCVVTAEGRGVAILDGSRKFGFGRARR